MSNQSVRHAMFVIERSYPPSPARVFKAWATPAAKARWFRGPEGWNEDIREMDFRVGGRERLRGVWDGGRSSDFLAHYHDIVAEQRIIYAYEMQVDEQRISVSLATVEFRPDGAGTRLVFTEQMACLEGLEDPAGREKGTRALLDRLGVELKSGAA